MFCEIIYFVPIIFGTGADSVFLVGFWLSAFKFCGFGCVRLAGLLAGFLMVKVAFKIPIMFTVTTRDRTANTEIAATLTGRVSSLLARHLIAVLTLSTAMCTWGQGL